MVKGLAVIRSLSRVTQVGLALLPWLPLAIMFFAFWDRYVTPKYVTEAFMPLHSPPVFYSQQHQFEEAYPHWRLFIAISVFAVVTFIVGIVLLIVAFFRSRRQRVLVTRTI